MELPIFIELTVVLLITVSISFLMRFLKQPLVVGYILAGIIVGPMLLNVVQDLETIELFSKIGITILLFIVGLHLSPSVIKEVGSVSLLTGIGQVLFTSTIGFLIAIMLGISTVAAIYVAIALTFSSTIIILKLLSDKGDTQTLYGKIAIGFLLVQDVVATIILIGVAALSGQSDLGMVPIVTLLLLKSLGIFVGLYAVTSWILPAIARYASRSQELLFVFSLSWGLGLAVLFQVLGLSVEIGALIAGVCLSSLPYAEEISSRLRPLRDFFIILFFIALGAQMSFSAIGEMIVPVLIFSSFVLIGNPIIVVILMNLLGYHKKTGFMAGLTVAQISEFSLILATLGLQVGHLSQEVLTMITLIGLITIAGSTYLILYSDTLYAFFEKYLSYLELKTNSNSQQQRSRKLDALLFGGDRTGHIFLRLIDRLGYRVGIVDFNPDVLDRYQHDNVYYFFGDASNSEFLHELPLNSTKIVIISLPDESTAELVISVLKARKKSLTIISFAHTVKIAEKLYAAGASYVVLPHEHAAEFIVSALTKTGFDRRVFDLHAAKFKKKIAAAPARS
ncbi:MAG: cation:proton antiporter [Patescibacteria group bacterium]